MAIVVNLFAGPGVGKSTTLDGSNILYTTLPIDGAAKKISDNVLNITQNWQ